MKAPETHKKKVYPTIEHNKWCILILKWPQHDTQIKRTEAAERILRETNWKELYEKLKSIK